MCIEFDTTLYPMRVCILWFVTSSTSARANDPPRSPTSPLARPAAPATPARPAATVTSAPGEAAPPLTARRARTRARLLQGAREVIAEHGVHGASVEEICARAGFTRGAFYSNFADRDELLLSLFADDRAALLARLHRVLADPPDDVIALIGAVLDQLHAGDPRERFLIRTEMTLHAVRTPSVAAALVEARAEFRAELRAAFMAAEARTDRRLELDPDLMVRTIEALHDGATAQSLLEPDVLPAGALQRAVLPRLLLAVTRPA